MRCAVDAAIKLGDSVQTVAVHALNEFDPKWSGERLAAAWQLPGSCLQAFSVCGGGPSCALGGGAQAAAVVKGERTCRNGSTLSPRFYSPPPPPPPAGVDWRQKLENQRGAVLATELKNNANKIAKWTAAALVA